MQREIFEDEMEAETVRAPVPPLKGEERPCACKKCECDATTSHSSGICLMCAVNVGHDSAGAA